MTAIGTNPGTAAAADIRLDCLLGTCFLALTASPHAAISQICPILLTRLTAAEVRSHAPLALPPAAALAAQSSGATLPSHALAFLFCPPSLPAAAAAVGPPAKRLWLHAAVLLLGSFLGGCPTAGPCILGGLGSLGVYA